MSEFECQDIILLTGAGFSKNFGGFLASEMWAKIFNYPGISTNERLGELFRNYFDFEQIYSLVVTDESYSAEDRALLNTAIKNAYRALDKVFTSTLSGSDFDFDTNGLWRFIDETIKGNRDRKGLFFTLNQDVLMERMYTDKTIYKAPGLDTFPQDFYASTYNPLNDSGFIKLPTELDRAKTDFEAATPIVYIKLHGSYGWLSSYDDSDQMVIGTAKEELIQKEPLLKFNFDIFNEALCQGNKKLLVMGYSFGDLHINKLILNAAENHGLTLFVLNPTQPQKLRQSMPDLWFYVKGYFPYTFRELFPKPYGNSQASEEVISSIKSELV